MADLPDVAARAVAPADALAALWAGVGLAPAALDRVALTGAEPALPTSFAVATAAQVAIAASALAATEIDRWRGRTAPARTVAVDLVDAARECSSFFTIDGVMPPIQDPVSGLYRCGRRSDPDRAAGWIRIHANFAHHRDGAVHLLGLGGRADVAAADVDGALANWRAEEIEEAADELGLPMAALRTTAQWRQHPQAHWLRGQPLVSIEKIGDAPPLDWPDRSGAGPQSPLAGLRVLDLTRVLAGPVGCRTLASLGADVLTCHAPDLPNIAAWPDTSRGKRSTALDPVRDQARLQALVAAADVFVEAARPGAIEAAGFGPLALHRLRPGIVAASLDAWGDQGPWGSRRGFDSLVQTATGLNDDERRAFGGDRPRPLPVQILDYATGFLLAFGIQAALLRQREIGGSWRVHLSLARTASWLRSLGRLEVADAASRRHGKPAGPGSTEARPTGAASTGAAATGAASTGARSTGAASTGARSTGAASAGADGTLAADALTAALVPFPSDFGRLHGIPHAARFSEPWPVSSQPSRRPGADAPYWPER